MSGTAEQFTLQNQIRLRVNTSNPFVKQNFFIAIAALVIVVSASSAFAQTPTSISHKREYNIKAVNIYGFGNYVKWPSKSFSKSNSRFVIGVLGNNPFGGALKTIADKKTINGRKILIKHLSKFNQAEDCQIVFISSEVNNQTVTQVVQTCKRKSVLVVADSANQMIRGVDVSFIVINGRVRFVLDLDQAKSSGLEVNAKLQRLGIPPDSQLLKSRGLAGVSN